MSTSHFGKEPAKKSYPTRAEAKPEADSGCSFCWFVLTIYPTLKGMTERDTATFRQHLTQAHGLKEDITE